VRSQEAGVLAKVVEGWPHLHIMNFIILSCSDLAQRRAVDFLRHQLG
jgi:hypothetical protein